MEPPETCATRVSSLRTVTITGPVPFPTLPSGILVHVAAWSTPPTVTLTVAVDSRRAVKKILSWTISAGPY
ncbi:hypothetical protein BTUL_0169g00020 [Botrytis tulipae]|uniref:Uncharacterized protein n=1 Tax=Botrytis tulipae TaxID=87230 RepID=A0A4Z1EFY8_9HELO|nr:hypothetical protein BTUL_0169g00020 [Botrytis tulipae]